jgi:glycosyltransferase involved in cell wall biosynthesis
MNRPYLSIVIPAYNEAKRIGTTLDSIATYFSNRNMDIEVIVVNDGSTDLTASVVSGYCNRYPYMRLLNIGRNYGKGSAVQRGMLSAKGTYRLFMDADNSVDISHLPEFLEA